MANRLFELVGEIAVKGARAAESAINSVDQTAEAAGESLQRAGDRTERFGQRMSDVGDRATAATGAVAALGFGAGKLVTSVANSAERLGQLSERLGVSIEFLQTWRRVAADLGIENEALRDGLKELSLRADEFAQSDKGPAADVFDRLGLSQSQIQRVKGDTEALFNLVLQNVRNVQGQAERQRIADELFGGQAGEQFVAMLGKSADEIERLKANAREEGGFFDEGDVENAQSFNRSLRDLGQSFDRVIQKVVAGMLPALTKMMPVIESQIVPAIGAAMNSLSGLVSAFAALPGPVQGAIVQFTALAAVVGPLMSIFGRVLVPIGKLVKLLGRTKGGMTAVAAASGAVKSAFTGIVGLFTRGAAAVTTILGSFKTLLSAALRPLMTLLTRASGVLTAFWAGWTAGKQILLPLIEMFPRVDRAIENTVGFIAVEVPKMLGQAWSAMKGMLSKMASGFVSTFKSIASSVVSTFTSMVSSVIDKAQQMWDSMTRNSIIPDMADEAIGAFERMADGSENAGERVRRGMTDAARAAESPGGRSGRNGGAGGDRPTVIDMSHSTFRDDRDMLDRLRRKGSDMSGAFT